MCVSQWGSFEILFFTELYSRLQIECEEKFGTGCEKTAMNTFRVLSQSFGLYVFITLNARFLTIDGNLGALYCHEQ
jgi:hypothetical protein